MKTLYLDCGMGAAGDMLTAALLELHPDPQTFLAKMNRLGLPGVRVTAQSCVKCGITGTRVSVTVDGREEDEVSEHIHAHVHKHEHENENENEPPHGHAHPHHHTGAGEIAHRIEHMDLPDAVKADALTVYDLLARAESEVHGVPAEEIHFHEVGSLDAVADVVGVCLLIHDLDIQKICASPIHVGMGQVRCAHGVMPVPAPATARLLRDIPTRGGPVEGELCTPTGAALLRHFVSEFGSQPLMRVQKIGYGMGKRDYEAANCLRAMLGETEEREGDVISELRCTLDDMTPEDIGFALERFREAGAAEVYTVPAQMKKDRPGTELTLLCRPEEREKFLRLLFCHTTTLGVREVECRRAVLQREERRSETPYGPVRMKTASGWGVERTKPEYDDLRRIAGERDIPITEIRNAVQPDRKK